MAKGVPKRGMARQPKNKHNTCDWLRRTGRPKAGQSFFATPAGANAWQVKGLCWPDQGNLAGRQGC
jgi:hypothetical protein